MNHRDLNFQLQCLFEGNIEKAALANLERELNASPEAREAYIDYAHLHNSLELRAHGIDLLHVVPMECANSRYARKFFRTTLMLAASAVVILGAVLALIASPSPTLKFVSSPGTDVVVSHDISGGKAPVGTSMEPGSRLEIRRGTVELTFASGVRGIIRGPADLTLRSPALLHLTSGTAWFEVPHKASGFQVSTQELVVTDLGTEFGIILRLNFPHEVHVFRGSVEADNTKGTKHKETLKAGEARVAELSGQWRSIPVNPKSFLRKLPKIEVPVIESQVIITELASKDQFAYSADVAVDDLLHGLKPETSGWNLDNNAHPDELTDGLHGAGYDEIHGDKVQGAWTKVGATATYFLGSGPNGRGYDLTSIRSIAAWNGAGFGNQTWTIEVKQLHGVFTQLQEVSFQPFEAEPLDGGGATKVTLTSKSGWLARGIEAIRFTAGRVPNSVDGAFVWRELDVLGVPSTTEAR